MDLKEIIVPHIATYDFGIGVDRASGTAMNLVVNQTQTEPVASGAVQTFEVSRVSSTEDLQKKLGIDVNASYGCASFGAGISARFDFAQQSQIHSESLFMTVSSTVWLADESIDNVVLSPGATGVADNPGLFQERFGDVFCRACKRGGLFVAVVSIETFDDAEATQMEAELQGSYALFSADASTKFSQVTTQHKASVYCSVYAEGGPPVQIADPSNPALLLDAANKWIQAIINQPGQYSRPYQWTLSPTVIANGPPPPNVIDLQHCQDVLMFCAQERARLLDQLNMLNWWMAHQDQYDWTGTVGAAGMAVAATNTQEDLDTVAACASAAMDNPAQAKMPADFAPTQAPPRAQKYGVSQPPPVAPKPVPPAVPMVTIPNWGDMETLDRGGDLPNGTHIPSADELGLKINAIEDDTVQVGSQGDIITMSAQVGQQVKVGSTVTVTFSRNAPGDQ